jgi:acyl carrier protein
MDTDTIYERLTPVFREVFDEDDLTPHAQMTAADVDMWDSLSNIRLVVAVEEEFGIQFTTAQITGLGNVGEFVDLIGRKIAKK